VFNRFRFAAYGRGFMNGGSRIVVGTKQIGAAGGGGEEAATRRANTNAIRKFPMLDLKGIRSCRIRIGFVPKIKVSRK
jgi:hypothetical protein